MQAAEFLDLSNSKSPQLTGNVIYALAKDSMVMQQTGKVLIVSKIALEYGIVDIDGRQPRPLTLKEA